MKIYIWGTGRLVGKVVGKSIQLENVEGFIDNDCNKSEFMGKRVYHPDEMYSREYDAIVVATIYAKEIHHQCKSLGLELKKIIYLYNNYEIKDLNEDYNFVSQILGKKESEVVRQRHHMIRGVEAKGSLCFENSQLRKNGYYESDYVRIKCLELAIKEIKKRKLQGSIAEVGVYKGEFAQYMNYAFPEKKFYLFDTFEGFSPDEADKEKIEGNCTSAFVEAYKNNNVNYVLNKIIYPENVVIKQGLFPNSLNGLEDMFSMVSIDVDFEDSIYECLKYFYPRLYEGGYMFIHDYNSDLLGVERAVDRYENDNSFFLNKVPLCDKNGTLVITK